MCGIIICKKIFRIQGREIQQISYNKTRQFYIRPHRSEKRGARLRFDPLYYHLSYATPYLIYATPHLIYATPYLSYALPYLYIYMCVYIIQSVGVLRCGEVRLGA
jgi:hypothetical protein